MLNIYALLNRIIYAPVYISHRLHLKGKFGKKRRFEKNSQREYDN